MYGLDHHITNHLKSNGIKTEFELFYQGLLKNLRTPPWKNRKSPKNKIKTNLWKL